MAKPSKWEGKVQRVGSRVGSRKVHGRVSGQLLSSCSKAGLTVYLREGKHDKEEVAQGGSSGKSACSSAVAQLGPTYAQCRREIKDRY